MKFFLPTVLAVILVVFLLPNRQPVIAADSTFGNFEVPIPALKGQSIDDVVKQNEPLKYYLGIILNIITAAIVMAGLISMTIGAYFYMTAGGDSGRVGTAKEFIIAALSGIALALTAWLILNTISGQFASNIKEPCVSTDKKPCPP